MTPEEERGWKEVIGIAQWHVDAMAERGVADYPGSERDKGVLWAAAELARLRAIEERAGDVEALKGLIYETLCQSPHEYSEDKSRAIARAVSAFLKGGGR